MSNLSVRSRLVVQRPHAMDAKRLQYSRRLLSQDSVTGRTGEAGLPVEVVQGECSAYSASHLSEDTLTT